MYYYHFHRWLKIFFFISLIINNIYPQDKKESNYYHETFGIVSDYKTQSTPDKLIRGDFNGDGWDDISVIGNDQVGIYYQSKDSIGLEYSIVSFSKRILNGAISKLQKDKFPIFVIGTSEPDEIRCYYSLNLSKKKLLWKTILQERFEDMVLNDLDGDKRTDIILFGRKQLGITYYRGNADGTFKKPIRLFTEYSFNNISIARLHDSEMPDFVGSSWLTNQILVYANNGNLKFSSPFAIDDAGETENIIAEYIDNDYYIDLITTNKTEKKIIFHKGDIGGGFLQKETKTISKVPSIMEIADCNSDGVMDIIVGSSASGTIDILLCDKKGNLVEEIPFSGGEFISDLIIFRNIKSSSNSMAILDAPNRKLKVFYSATIRQIYNGDISYATGVKPVSILVEDIDNDGLPDVIVSNNESKTLSLFINSTRKGLSGQIAYDLPGHPSKINFCRNKNNNTVIVSSDYAESKLLIAELNVTSLSCKTSTILTQQKSSVINTFSETKTEPLRIFCLQENEKNKSMPFVMYQRLQRDRFIEKVLIPAPCVILKAVTFIQKDKKIIYASWVPAKNKIELYHSILTADAELSRGKMIAAINNVDNCTLKMYPVRLNDDDLDDLVISLGEPENKLYIFYGTNGNVKESSKNQTTKILNNIESANYEFYDLDNNGLNDITYLNNKTKAIDARFAETDGTFGNARQIKAVGEISDYKFTDLNKDSLPELLITDYKNGLLKIIRLED